MADKGAVVFGGLGVVFGLGAVVTLFGLPAQVVMKSDELALPTFGRKDLDTSSVMFRYSAATYESYLDTSNPKHSLSIAGVRPVCEATISPVSVCAQPFVDSNENTTEASVAVCREGGKVCQVLGADFQGDVEELHWALRKLRIAAVLCTPFIAFLIVTGSTTFGTGGGCSGCGDARGVCGAILTVILGLILFAIGASFIAFLVGVGFAVAGGYWVQEERSTVMQDPQVQRVVGTFGGSFVPGSFPEEGPAKATYGWAMSAAVFFAGLVILGSAYYAYLHMDTCIDKFLRGGGAQRRNSGDDTDTAAAAAAGGASIDSNGGVEQEGATTEPTKNPVSVVAVSSVEDV